MPHGKAPSTPTKRCCMQKLIMVMIVQSAAKIGIGMWAVFDPIACLLDNRETIDTCSSSR